MAKSVNPQFATAEEIRAAGGRGRFVRRHHVHVSQVALTETTLPALEERVILLGHRPSILKGLPPTGRVDFFQAGQAEIGEANTNHTGESGKLDFHLDLQEVGFEIVFPRAIIDGADLRQLGDGGGGAGEAHRPGDPLAAAKLGDVYHRLMLLFEGSTMLALKINGDERMRAPLQLVGAGVTTRVEGLALSSSESQTYTDGGVLDNETVAPTAVAFSMRYGMRKRDQWRLGSVTKEEWSGLELEDNQAFELFTETDSKIVRRINDDFLAGGRLYEDRQVGIRLFAYLEGDRYQKVGVGVRAA